MAVADSVAARKLGDPKPKRPKVQQDKGVTSHQIKKVGTAVPPCPHERHTKELMSE